MSDSIPKWCKVQYFIDAKDSMNDWCVALVTEINEVNKTITVYHDGWGTRTTTYPFRSSKIAPFRKNTAKYTGPKRGALRDWEISENELNDYQDQVNKILASGLNMDDPFYITQFFRGKLFIFIENLLMCNYRINKKFLTPVVVFFGSVIKLIVMWLKKAPDLFPYFYKSLAQPDLYLEDSKTALALVWYELMDTLNKLFALDSRVSDFFQSYDRVPEEYEPSPLSLMNDKKYSETLMYMINLFTKEKGFEAVIDILNEKDEVKRVPFPFIATTLLYVLGQFFDKDFWARFNQDLTSSVLQRIDIISESELKDLKHEDIIRVLSMIKDNKENLDIKKLNFFLRMLKCNYFEKRIKGLSEINSVIEAFDKKVEINKSKISKDELKDWVLRNNLMELVINDRPHVELIKRSSVIFRFLAENKSLNPSHLDMLWGSMQGKHDSYIRATHSAILEFTSYLSEDLHDFLYSKIKSVPFESYEESFLNFFTEFTHLALDIAIRSALYKRKDLTKDYGLEIFEKLILDDCPVDFCKISCKNIGNILSNPLASKLRSSYMNKLLVLVSKNDSVPQALNLIIRLLKGIKDFKRLAGEIKVLNESQKLVELVLNNLKLYLNTERTENVWDKVLVGRFSHQSNLTVRLKFIEFIINKSGSIIKMTQENLEELWKILGQSKIVQEKHLFFSWVTKGIKEKPPLDPENVEFLFKVTVLDDDSSLLSSMTEDSFSYFKNIFIMFHANQHNIELQNGKFKYRKSKGLQGFEKLVQIQLNSEECSQEAAKFIISLLLRFSSSSISLAASILEDFTGALLSILLKNKDNDSLITRGLLLLKMLLSDSESSPFTANSYVYVQESMTREFYKIHYDQSLNIRHLRREISKHFGKPVESVTLIINDKKISGVDDDCGLAAFKAHCINVDFKQAEYKEFNPLPNLSQNQRVIKSLFEILNNSDKSYLDAAWNLLVALPINQHLEQAFEGFDMPLNELLTQTNIYMLLYELIIIRNLSENKQWKQKFLKKQGLEVLLGIFQDNLASPIRQESLIRTISLFLTENTVVEGVEKFVQVFFTSFKDAAKAANEIKDLESFNKALEAIISYLETCHLQVTQTFLSTHSAVLEELFENVLFTSENLIFAKKIRDLLENLAKYSEISNAFFSILYNLRNKAVLSSNEHYWKLLAFIFNRSQVPEPERKVVIEELVSFISSAPCEKNSNNKNETLGGALIVLKSAWTSNIAILPEYKSLFLTKCLFEIPDSLEKTTSMPPICKHSETRNEAFELLLVLCKHNEGFLQDLVKELDKHHEEPDWRGTRKTEWSISAVSKEKSQSGLVGLKNLGCTCYMNSMMQQIFMIQSFRQGILSIKLEPYQEGLLYQLQYLFTALQYSDKQYINPKSFASTIKDYEGNPINMNEQMDVDEFFNYFMDKLEAYIKESPQKNLIKAHFGGLQVTELIGQDCPHRSERYEPFLTVSVEVKNKKSLQEGLESFVAGEMLEGENAYQCDHCEAKVRAVRRVCLKHLPNFLIIALRRFEFDFETMNRVKLNDFCEFPLDIDLEPYTQEGLDKLDKEKGTGNMKRFSDDYYKYKLRGIVIHAGTAENGHYYSYIQDQFKKWFEFNDVWVKEFDTADIPDECFGGEEKFSWSSVLTNSQNTGIREKCGNAYLLFYERTGIYAVRNGDEEVLEPASLAVGDLEELDHMKLIRKQNKVYWRNKHIFASEYSKFIHGLSVIENMPFKFIFKFFLTIMLRTKEKREELISVYSALEQGLIESKENSNWALEVISVEGVCKELLLYCPVHLMRKMVVGLIKTAFTNADQLVLEGVMLRLLKLLPLSRKEYTKNFAQYHEVLKHSILSAPALSAQYKVLQIVIKYLLQRPFKVPMSPDPIYKDVYLGYENYTHPDIEKPDTFYTDSKSTTLGHLFHLLYTQHENIPKKYKDLLKQAETIDEFLRLADNKLTLKFMGKLYAELVYNDPNTYQSFIRKVIEFSHHQEFYKKSLINKILTPLLLKSCPASSDISRFFLTWKNKQVRASKIYNDIEPNINYVLNLCAKSKDFQQILKEHLEIMSFMEKWVREHMSYGFTSSKIPSYEESRPALRSIYSKLQKISKGEELFSPTHWDSDDEIDEEKLQKDKQVDIFDGNSQHWVKGTIKQRIGDLLLMQIRGWDNSEYSTLKETYGEDIAPLGTFTRSYP